MSSLYFCCTLVFCHFWALHYHFLVGRSVLTEFEDDFYDENVSAMSILSCNSNIKKVEVHSIFSVLALKVTFPNLAKTFFQM